MEDFTYTEYDIRISNEEFANTLRFYTYCFHLLYSPRFHAPTRTKIDRKKDRLLIFTIYDIKIWTQLDPKDGKKRKYRAKEGAIVHIGR